MARLSIDIVGKIDSQFLKNLREIRTIVNSMAGSLKALDRVLVQNASSFNRARTATQGAAGSYREAQQRLTALGRAIRDAEGGFRSQNPAIQAQIALYRQLNGELRTFDRQMGLNYRNVGNYGSGIAGLTKQVLGLSSAYMVVLTAIRGLSAVAKMNIDISDSLSDVRRTAELSSKEVRSFSNELKNIPTRTGLSELLEIATIGGQLGIAKSELAGFVQALDFLGVALANEIPGGAEAVAEALGKINGVFRVAETNGLTAGEAMQKTGSAILALGQAGLATGEYLVNFTQRVGGAARTVGISLPTVLAYGATLEEAGVSAEVAGTAVSKLFGQIALRRTDFHAIAQIADATLTLEQFTDLINTDADTAMRKFFAGLQAGGTTTTQYYDILKTAGVNTERYRNAVLLLAQDQEKLTELTALSTKEFEDGSKAAEQFAMRNMNLAGVIAQVGRLIKEAFISPDAQSGLAKFIANVAGLTRESDWLGMKLSDLSQEYRDQQAELNPLMDRYDELSRNQSRSIVESDELRDITEKISLLLPSAVTDWDKYGKAISISTNRINELTGAQRELMATLNRSLLLELDTQVKSLELKLSRSTRALNDFAKAGKDSFIIPSPTKSGNPILITLEETQEQIKNTRADLTDLYKQIQDAGGRLSSDQRNLLAYYGFDEAGKAMREHSAGLKTVVDLKKDGNAEDAKQLAIIPRLKQELADLRKQQEEETNIAFLPKIAAEIKAKEAEIAAALGNTVKNAVDSSKQKVEQAMSKLSEIMAQALSKTEDDQGTATIEERYRKLGEQALTAFQTGIKAGGNRESLFQLLSDTEIALAQAKAAELARKAADDLTRERTRAARDISDITIKYERRSIEGIDRVIAKKINDRYKAEINAINETNKKRIAESTNVAATELQIAAENIDTQLKLQEQYYRDLESIAAVEGLKNVGWLNIEAAIKEAEVQFDDFIKGIEDTAERSRLEGMFGSYIDFVRGQAGQKMTRDLSNIAGEIDSIIGAFERMDQGFGSVLKGLGQLAQSFSRILTDIGKATSDLSKNVGDLGLGGIGDTLGKAGSIISAVGSVWSFVSGIFKRNKEEAERQKEAIKQYYRDIEAGERSYQSLLRDRARAAASYASRGDIPGLRSEINLAIRQREEAYNDYSKALDRLYETGKYKITGEEIAKQMGKGMSDFLGNRFPDLIIEANLITGKTIPGLLARFTESYDKLEKLYEEGRLTADTEKDFLALRKLKEEIESTGMSIESFEKTIKEMLTGTTVTQLADRITDLFKDGKTSAEDFGKSLEDVLKNAAFSAFQAKYATQLLTPFFDELASQMDSEQYDTEKLSEKYLDAATKYTSGLEALGKGLGVDLKNPIAEDASRSGLRGAIERMSEQTGSELTGIYRASFEVDKQSLTYLIGIDTNTSVLVTLGQSQLDIMSGIKDDTGAIADHTSHLGEISETLVMIANNTKEKSLRGSGL